MHGKTKKSGLRETSDGIFSPVGRLTMLTTILYMNKRFSLFHLFLGNAIVSTKLFSFKTHLRLSSAYTKSTCL